MVFQHFIHCADIPDLAALRFALGVVSPEDALGAQDRDHVAGDWILLDQRSGNDQLCETIR